MVGKSYYLLFVLCLQQSALKAQDNEGWCEFRTHKNELRTLIHLTLLQLIMSVLVCDAACLFSAVQVISFEGDRTVIPLGQSVSYTCTVNEGRTEWVFGPENRYTLNTYSHTGSIPLSDSINVSLSSYTDEGDIYISILTIPSTSVIQLNDTDVTCKVKPAGKFSTAFGPRHLRIQVFGKLCYAFCKLTFTVCCTFSLLHFANPHLASLFSVGSSTSPGHVRVLSERDLEVTLTWDPSFLPFNITPQYKVYVDGVLEGTMEQPMFRL